MWQFITIALAKNTTGINDGLMQWTHLSQAGCLTDMNQEVLGAIESLLGVGTILCIVGGCAASLAPHLWDVSSNPLSFDTQKHLQMLPSVPRLEGAPEHQVWVAGSRGCREWEDPGGHCRLKLQGHMDCAQRSQWPWWNVEVVQMWTGAQTLPGLEPSHWELVCRFRGQQQSILGADLSFPSRASACCRNPVAFTT